jgi:hypothetical protein
VAQIGVTEEEEFYSLASYELTNQPVTLDLRNIGSGGSMQPSEYPLAYMAVQYLLASHGKSIASLVQVYQNMRNGSAFDTAFTLEFGNTLDEFYRDFEIQRAGMNDVYVLDDDFYLNSGDGDTSQGDFRWIVYPQETDHRRQLIFVGQTSPLEDCSLDLQISGQSIRRDTWANGQGQIFWLVSLPDGAQPGIGYLYVKCGLLFHHSVLSVK